MSLTALNFSLYYNLQLHCSCVAILIFDTQTAIPVGTLAAVIVSGITYVMMVWSLASICEREGGRGGLFKDFAIMMPASADWIEESAVAPLIIAGT